MRHVLAWLGIATVAGCAAPHAEEPPVTPDALVPVAVVDADREADRDIAWGAWSGPLRLRADSPSVLARGDRCEVELAVETAPGETVRLDIRGSAYFTRLRLRPAAGGPEVVIVPEDPTAGMPDPPPPPGEPADVVVSGEHALATVGFPLATAWDRVTAGRWLGTVEYTVPDGGRVRNSYPAAGGWRGTLVSAPFEIEVTPAPERWLDVRVPAALLGGDVEATLRFPVRNGFAVGLDWRGDLSDGSTGGNLGGGPQPGMFDELVARIAAASGSPTFTLFETSYHPEHMWHPGPGSGHYRVLWKR